MGSSHRSVCVEMPDLDLEYEAAIKSAELQKASAIEAAEKRRDTQLRRIRSWDGLATSQQLALLKCNK